MSISSEISRISQNITDSLTAVANKGVTVPGGSTSDNLPNLISQISTGGSYNSGTQIDYTNIPLVRRRITAENVWTTPGSTSPIRTCMIEIPSYVLAITVTPKKNTVIAFLSSNAGFTDGTNDGPMFVNDYPGRIDYSTTTPVTYTRTADMKYFYFAAVSSADTDNKPTSVVFHYNTLVSNYITGTFKTGVNVGTTETFSIPYLGTGYPIAAMIYITGGMYNNSTGGNTEWYNLVHRYAVGQWTLHKSRQNTTPTYGTSGADNYGVVTSVYKSSTSTATSYSRNSSANLNAYTSSDAAESVTGCVVFKGDGKTLSVFIADASYGLQANTEYTYHIIYSS